RGTGCPRQISQQPKPHKLRSSRHAYLQLGAGDILPMTGEQIAAGRLTFAPETITFLATPAAHTVSCR
ncbi:hypothetical protein ACH0BU_17470, partial [Sphingomonas olei]